MITRRSLVVAGAAACSVPAQANGPADWVSADGQAQGLRSGPVADALVAAEALPGLRALVAARNGCLVAERDFAGATVHSLLPINSATKSVCSMLVGLALEQGQLTGLDATVAQLIPEALAQFPESPAGPLTPRQLLCGRSGLAFDWRHFNQIATARTMVRHVLGLPAVPVAPPGWSYNDAMVALLAPILAHAHGGCGPGHVGRPSAVRPPGHRAHYLAARWRRQPLGTGWPGPPRPSVRPNCRCAPPAHLPPRVGRVWACALHLTL